MVEENGKTALFLLGMGGPESVDDIEEYLYNIFSDRHIIRLPGGMLCQKTFAKLIAKFRKKKVIQHYSLIGGSSPLFKWTEAQLEHLKFILSPLIPGLKYYIAMRYFKPLIPDMIKQALHDGCRKFIFLPMYPQYCKATTGSTFHLVNQTLNGHKDVDIKFINDFHDNDQFIELLKKYINENIQQDETLLFSAHSIPQHLFDQIQNKPPKWERR